MQIFGLVSKLLRTQLKLTLYYWHYLQCIEIVLQFSIRNICEKWIWIYFKSQDPVTYELRMSILWKEAMCRYRCITFGNSFIIFTGKLCLKEYKLYKMLACNANNYFHQKTLRTAMLRRPVYIWWTYLGPTKF